MTPEEMRDAIEAAYAATLRAHGGTYMLEVPAGVTPLAWAETLKPDTDLSARGEGLAMAGLHYGCTQFARLLVQDRPEAKVASQGGRAGAIQRKRPRAFIVHALGWGDKEPEYTHTKSWPHRMGADVPETSKRPKGDAQ